MRSAVILLLAIVCQVCGGELEQQLEKGEQFLVKMFNPRLGLLPEYPGATVYWLYHDNYLAAKALEKRHPDLAKKIRETIHSYGYTNSGKIEIVYGESPHALPFRHYILTNVTVTNGATIKTEVVSDKKMEGWENYADLVFLNAIAQARENKDPARKIFKQGLAMWDGKGFKDPATEKLKRYATYKLALGLLASKTTGEPLPMKEEVVSRLKDLQSKSGGWITDYLPDGTPIGMANVETSCLVMLALKKQGAF